MYKKNHPIFPTFQNGKRKNPVKRQQEVSHKDNYDKVVFAFAKVRQRALTVYMIVFIRRVQASS